MRITVGCDRDGYAGPAHDDDLGLPGATRVRRVPDLQLLLRSTSVRDVNTAGRVDRDRERKGLASAVDRLGLPRAARIGRVSHLEAVVRIELVRRVRKALRVEHEGSRRDFSPVFDGLV